MLHVSQIKQDSIYKLNGKIVKITNIFKELLSTNSAIIIYEQKYKGYKCIRTPIEVDGITDFEELTSLEKELL